MKFISLEQKLKENCAIGGMKFSAWKDV
jgi:hypothetical protein